MLVEVQVCRHTEQGTLSEGGDGEGLDHLLLGGCSRRFADRHHPFKSFYLFKKADFIGNSCCKRPCAGFCVDVSFQVLLVCVRPKSVFSFLVLLSLGYN